MLGERLVDQAERVRQRLPGQHLQAAVLVATGEVGGALPATVEHQHAGGAPVTGDGRGQPRRRGMRDVVGHEPDLLAVQARQGGGQEPGAFSA